MEEFPITIVGNDPGWKKAIIPLLVCQYRKRYLKARNKPEYIDVLVPERLFCNFMMWAVDEKIITENEILDCKEIIAYGHRFKTNRKDEINITDDFGEAFDIIVLYPECEHASRDRFDFLDLE